MDPDSWLTQCRFGRLKELQDDIETSIRAVRSAIGTEADQAWMWPLGHLLMKQRLWEDADRALRQALSIDPRTASQGTLRRLQELRG
jgi:uncharacterized protein HemY